MNKKFFEHAKLSMIIPTLNAAEYLPKLIDVLERQTLKA